MHLRLSQENSFLVLLREGCHQTLRIGNRRRSFWTAQKCSKAAPYFMHTLSRYSGNALDRHLTETTKATARCGSVSSLGGINWRNKCADVNELMLTSGRLVSITRRPGVSAELQRASRVEPKRKLLAVVPSRLCPAKTAHLLRLPVISGTWGVKSRSYWLSPLTMEGRWTAWSHERKDKAASHTWPEDSKL